MKATRKHAALLFALVVPALLAACKPGAAGVPPPAAEARTDAANPFVGLWEMTISPQEQEPLRSWAIPQGYRHFFKFSDDGQFVFYNVAPDGAILLRNEKLSRGAYKSKGSKITIDFGPVISREEMQRSHMRWAMSDVPKPPYPFPMGHETVRGRLVGDALETLPPFAGHVPGHVPSRV